MNETCENGGHPKRQRRSYRLHVTAIAAVVIGGTALSGGRGTIRGTLIGAFVIGFLVDGLVLIGVSVFWQETIKGAVIIVAVAVEEIQRILERRQKLKSAS